MPSPVFSLRRPLPARSVLCLWPALASARNSRRGPFPEGPFPVAECPTAQFRLCLHLGLLWGFLLRWFTAFWPLCMAALLGPVLCLAFWLWFMRGQPAARHMARHAVDMQLRASQGLAATTKRPCRRVAGLLTLGNGPRGDFLAVRTG